MIPTSADASDALTETLVASGVTAVFGNPGTTELPIVQAIGRRPELTYYLCLHESIATGMAAGYAIATGKAGVSLLHVAPGLANGLSNVYNSFRNRVPLVVLSGQQDRRHQLLNPVLYGDLVGMMRPVTKWAWEAQTVEDVPKSVARAISDALSPAQAPTFVSIPLDLQTAPLTLPPDSKDVRPTPKLGAAPYSTVQTAVTMLHSATSPAIIAGDLIGVTRTADVLKRVAHEFAAAVYWEPVSTYANYPTSDPMFQGIMFPNARNFEDVFARHDVVLACGLGLSAPAVFGGVHWSSSQNRTVVLTDDSSTIPGIDVDVTLLGDPAATLEALLAELGQRAIDQYSREGAKRRTQLREKHSADRERIVASAAKRVNDVPINPTSLMAALYDKLPANTSVVDESLSNSAWVQLAGQFTNELDYVGGTKGGGIGFGLPAALGVAVGNPDRAVVAVIGDGSSMYSIQALWTAARYRIPVVFCILNNASYKILKGGLMTLTGLEPDEVAAVPGLDLTEPEIDFVELSRSLGVDAVRVDSVDTAVTAVLDALAAAEPRLIDIPVDRSVRKVFS